LRACVESLLRARAAGEISDIVVVDSGSSDDSVDMARGLLRDSAVLRVPNRGYGAAANAGIAVTSSDHVLVLNADTVIPPGTSRALSELLDAEPFVGIVGPRLRYPDGSIQPSRRRFPGRLTPLFESTVIEEWWPGNRLVRHYRMEDEPDDVIQDVDWVVGAAMLVRRSAIEQAGGFDPSFRMYAEEVEWCWRLRSRGWRVVYMPGAEIIHHEGASTGQDIPARQYEFDVSRVRLTRRLYGRRHAAFVRYALLAGYCVQVSREGLKWLIGHRRPLRRQRVALYVRLIRSRLCPAAEEPS
jgi:N-acetylglucosaminyl-diphospho-decaprenol L-rhamnosyltransferase